MFKIESKTMLIYNGRLMDTLEVDINNRAFQYGDALFETIKWSRGRPLFWDDHYERLLQSMALLKMELPENFGPTYLMDLMQQLTNKNNCDESARIRLQVYRNTGGYYLPETNSVGYVITASILMSAAYKLNKNPLQIGIYSNSYKTATTLSTIKSSNALLYILASLFAKENNWDDCFLLNDKGHVIETTNANIFISKNEVIKTPPLTDGCLNGIMRKQVLNFFHANKISIQEQSLTFDEVLNADEIILTNTIGGIRLVKCNGKLNWLDSLIFELNN